VVEDVLSVSVGEAEAGLDDEGADVTGSAEDSDEVEDE